MQAGVLTAEPVGALLPGQSDPAPECDGSERNASPQRLEDSHLRTAQQKADRRAPRTAGAGRRAHVERHHEHVHGRHDGAPHTMTASSRTAEHSPARRPEGQRGTWGCGAIEAGADDEPWPDRPRPGASLVTEVPDAQSSEAAGQQRGQGHRAAPRSSRPPVMVESHSGTRSTVPGSSRVKNADRIHNATPFLADASAQSAMSPAINRFILISTWTTGPSPIDRHGVRSSRSAVLTVEGFGAADCPSRYIVIPRDDAPESEERLAAEHSRGHGAQVGFVYRNALGASAIIPNDRVAAVRADVAWPTSKSTRQRRPRP